MKRVLFISVLFAAVAFTSCSSNNSFHSEPTMKQCGDTIFDITITIEEDATRDEWGNCKKSSYTKFYEEWEEREGWENEMERVYDAWRDKDDRNKCYVQVIACIDADMHKYEVRDYQMKDDESYRKYVDMSKGYGGNKGMIFDRNDAL